MRLAHAQRLERWFGAEWLEQTSRAMQGFRYPVPIIGYQKLVVYDGDFYGTVKGGLCASLVDHLMNERGGFADTTALKGNLAQAAVNPQGFNKASITIPASGSSSIFWSVGIWPVAGSNASGTPGGTVPNNTTTGAFPIDNAATGKTMHLKELWVEQGTTAASKSLLVYDYLFGVNINHATTSNSVTGVPTRYQTAALAPGNFISGRVTTALGATAHNITITYVDQDGNTAEAGSAQAVRVSSAVDSIPFTQPKWFYFLNSADTGARNITNIALSAASTGNVDWIIGHTIGIVPSLQFGQGWTVVDGVNSNMLLDRVFDGACLAFLMLFGGSGTGLNGRLILAEG